MNSTCNYCRGPLSGGGLRGRPWPGREAGCYCCYGCLSLGEEDAAGPQSGQHKELTRLGWRLGAGVLLTGQSMLLGLGVNLAPPDEPAFTRLLQALVLGCTAIVLALLGGPLFSSTIRELRQRRITVEALFVLTLVGALGASLQSFLTGEGPIYFETVSVLLVVYTISKLIVAQGRAGALARSQTWTAELSRCRVIDEQGRCREVEISAILPNDAVEVRPGETVAVDGVIIRGTGFVCEAAQTGEPFARVRRPGDIVLAGCVSEDAVFVVRATARGTERRIDRLLKAVDEARDSPSSLQAQADRLAQLFLPILLTVAMLTFCAWTYLTNWQTGLFNAMSVLLVACPCALGLATPIVVWSALARLAERGLIARQGDFIERLASADRVVLDKTGTLTEEQYVLADLAVSPDADRASLLRLLAAAESRSSHPVARAFAGLVPREELEAVRILSLRTVAGCGIEAEVENDQQHRLRIGSTGWLGTDSAALFDALQIQTGHRIDIELDGKLAAVAMVAERLRGSSEAALADMRLMGLGVEVMTGDTAERAAAALAGTPISGSMSPEQKQARLREQMEAGAKPLFVGDGINDAPALAAATAGIALASGTDLAVGASAATLYGGDLRVLPWAIALSREAVRIVRSTLLWAAAYNLLGMTLAALGLLHPIAAALLMTFSSLWVAWKASRTASVTVVCHAPEPTSGFDWRAAVHASALAVQGLVVVRLLDIVWPVSAAVVLAFVCCGAALTLCWWTWSRLPHGLDMLFGMLTLGNLGMIAGWWMDLGFRSAGVDCPCGCATLLSHGGPDLSAILAHPGMWLGMILTCNLAMLHLTRTPCPLAQRTPLRFILGNAGMVLGMIAGSALANWLVLEQGWLGPITHLSGMTVGMSLGMSLVHAAALRKSSPLA